MRASESPGTVVLLGSSGMLGQELISACPELAKRMVAFADSTALDVTDEAAVRAALVPLKPAIIINATAYTNVDGAESDRDQAARVNGDGPGILARIAVEQGALLVHYSTDYVFNGEGRRPYAVTDPTDPVNWYGATKLAGEVAIRRSGCRHLIIRTSWLYAPHGRNFVQTILQHAAAKPELRVVMDQRGRPTLAADLAEMTCRLIHRGAEGTFHATNSGDCSWFEFAEAIVDEAGLACRVLPIETNEFPRPARRPRFSVLDLSGTTNLIGQPRHWLDALRACLREILPGAANHLPTAAQVH